MIIFDNLCYDDETVDEGKNMDNVVSASIFLVAETLTIDECVALNQ